MSDKTHALRKTSSATLEDDKPFSPVLVTERGVQSQTIPGIIAYDKLKTSREHFHDFCDIAEAKLAVAEPSILSLVTGVASGLVAIQIGKNRGDFVPNLKPGRYGVEHTANGSLLTNTKRIIDLQNGTTSVFFGIIREEWPDGLNSCALVRPDIEGRGPIRLLADDSEIPIEPTPGCRFYTPFFHIPGAGSGFITRGPNSEPEANSRGLVYPPYLIGIMTMDRESLGEILRGFNEDWSNGPVFSCKNPATGAGGGGGTIAAYGKGGLEQWC